MAWAVVHRRARGDVSDPADHVAGGADFAARKIVESDGVDELAVTHDDVRTGRLPGVPANVERRADDVRIGEIAGRVRELESWRLTLTGVADRNGRIGKLAEDVADLRADVGTSEERRTERAVIAAVRWARGKMLAAIGAIGVLIGGAAYSIKAGYDAAAEARGRDAEWRHGVDKDLDRLFKFFHIDRSKTE